jgi:hypothetical protein
VALKDFATSLGCDFMASVRGKIALWPQKPET